MKQIFSREYLSIHTLPGESRGRVLRGRKAKITKGTEVKPDKKK